jgi:hypothetical protein
MAGKGDKARERQVPRSEFEDNWDAAFGGKQWQWGEDSYDSRLALINGIADFVAEWLSERGLGGATSPDGKKYVIDIGIGLQPAEG